MYYDKIIFIIFLAPDIANEKPDCGTYGCKGIGHFKGPKYATHNSPSGCPYSPQNVAKTRNLPDRLLNLKSDIPEFEDDYSDKVRYEKIEKTKHNKTEKLAPIDVKPPKVEKYLKQEDEDSFDKIDKFDISER